MVYQVKLKDALVSSLKFAMSQDTELAWVDGQLAMEERGEKFDKMETDEEDYKQDVVPVLEQLSPDNVSNSEQLFSDNSNIVMKLLLGSWRFKLNFSFFSKYWVKMIFTKHFWWFCTSLVPLLFYFYFIYLFIFLILAITLFNEIKEFLNCALKTSFS